AGLDLVVQTRKGEIECRAEDVERGGEVVSAMGEDEGARVNEAEGEVQAGGGEGRGREGEGWRLEIVRRRRGGRGPGEECIVEVGAAGDEDKAVGGEYCS